MGFYYGLTKNLGLECGVKAGGRFLKYDRYENGVGYCYRESSGKTQAIAITGLNLDFVYRFGRF